MQKQCDFLFPDVKIRRRILSSSYRPTIGVDFKIQANSLKETLIKLQQRSKQSPKWEKLQNFNRFDINQFQKGNFLQKVSKQSANERQKLRLQQQKQNLLIRMINPQNTSLLAQAVCLQQPIKNSSFYSVNIYISDLMNSNQLKNNSNQLKNQAQVYQQFYPCSIEVHEIMNLTKKDKIDQGTSCQIIIQSICKLSQSNSLSLKGSYKHSLINKSNDLFSQSKISSQENSSQLNKKMIKQQSSQSYEGKNDFFCVSSEYQRKKQFLLSYNQTQSDGRFYESSSQNMKFFRDGIQVDHNQFLLPSSQQIGVFKFINPYQSFDEEQLKIDQMDQSMISFNELILQRYPLNKTSILSEQHERKVKEGQLTIQQLFERLKQIEINHLNSPLSISDRQIQTFKTLIKIVIKELKEFQLQKESVRAFNKNQEQVLFFLFLLNHLVLLKIYSKKFQKMYTEQIPYQIKIVGKNACQNWKFLLELLISLLQKVITQEKFERKYAQTLVVQILRSKKLKKKNFSLKQFGQYFLQKILQTIQQQMRELYPSSVDYEKAKKLFQSSQLIQMFQIINQYLIKDIVRKGKKKPKQRIEFIQFFPEQLFFYFLSIMTIELAFQLINFTQVQSIVEFQPLKVLDKHFLNQLMKQVLKFMINIDQYLNLILKHDQEMVEYFCLAKTIQSKKWMRKFYLKNK